MKRYQQTPARLFRASLMAVIVGLGGSLAVPAWSETLQEALISAYHNHPRMLAERARLREIDETYIQARSQGRLTSDIGGNIGYLGSWVDAPNSATPPTSITRSTLYSGSTPSSFELQVIQPIYKGGRVKALRRQAKANILAARELYRDAEQNILLGTASAYVDIIRDEESAAIRRNNLSVLMRQLDAANIRFEAGMGTLTDVAQAQSRLASAKIGLAQAEAQLQSSRADYLNFTAHVPVSLQEVPHFVLPATLPEALIIARENNPQLIASVLNEQAAEAGIDVAKSNKRPTLSIAGSASGNYDQLIGIEEYYSAGVFAQLSIPLISGGYNSSQERSAKLARARMRFETRDFERTLDQTVRQIWAQLEAAKVALSAAEEQVRSAQIAFTGVELEHEVGTQTTLDVLNADQELQNARLNVVNAQADVHKLGFQLLSILGGFDAISLSLPTEYYDPSQNLTEIKAHPWTDKIYREDDFDQLPVRTSSSAQPRGRIELLDNSTGLVAVPTQ